MSKPIAATRSPSMTTSARVVSVAVTMVPFLMTVLTTRPPALDRTQRRGSHGPSRILFRDDERRRQPDRVAIQAALADQQALLLAGLQRLDRTVGMRLLGLAVLHHLDADHQALAS